MPEWIRPRYFLRLHIHYYQTTHQQHPTEPTKALITWLLVTLV